MNLLIHNICEKDIYFPKILANYSGSSNIYVICDDIRKIYYDINIS